MLDNYLGSRSTRHLVTINTRLLKMAFLIQSQKLKKRFLLTMQEWSTHPRQDSVLLNKGNKTHLGKNARNQKQRRI